MDCTRNLPFKGLLFRFWLHRVRSSAQEIAVKKTITLDIAGASYRMNVDADEEHLRKLAEIVNDRVAALGPNAAQRATPAQLLAMVALGLADEWLTSSARVRAVEDTTRRAIVNAIARIDRRLAADIATPADA
jgi:cell division protein ZapA (FtsZ GTPase activity inhibitor)